MRHSDAMSQKQNNKINNVNSLLKSAEYDSRNCIDCVWKLEILISYYAIFIEKRSECAIQQRKRPNTRIKNHPMIIFPSALHSYIKTTTQKHNRNVTWASRCFKSPTTEMLVVQQFGETNNTWIFKVSHCWPIVRRIHQWRIGCSHKGAIIGSTSPCHQQ